MAVAAPTLIPGLENVKEVAASTHHSFFLTKDHKVFSCGRGHSYRLGHGDEKETDVPSEIVGLTSLPEDDKVLSIATGEAHGMAVTAAGNLYTWGYGDLLQLGNGDEKDEKVPRMVTSAQLTDKEKRNVVRAAAGSQHSVIIATDA